MINKLAKIKEAEDLVNIFLIYNLPQHSFSALKVLFLMLIHLFLPIYTYCNSEYSENVIVLTPQRCGTHWLLYSLRNLTKASPIHGVEVNEFSPLADSKLDIFGKPINYNKYFYVHAHLPIWIPEGYEQNKLICIIRNYKESLLRMYDFTYIKSAIGKRYGDRFFEQLSPYDTVISWYFENLKFYDEYTGNKILIYYEDLISEPERVFRRLLLFLDVSDQYLTKFMSKIDNHKKKSLSFYDNHRFGSKSRGTDFHFHSRKLDKSELITFDQLVNNNYPSLYVKYLYRYKEREN